MISSVELRRVAAFSDLQDDQIEWFLSHVQEVFLHGGDSRQRSLAALQAALHASLTDTQLVATVATKTARWISVCT
jgi:hypothetical protein